jgi:hypothetical protein
MWRFSENAMVKISRRIMISGVAASLLGGSATGLAAAESSDFKEKYLRSLRYRKYYDLSTKKWHNYLKQEDFDVGLDSVTKKFSRNKGPSTQKFDYGECELKLSKALYENTLGLDFEWTLYHGDLDDFVNWGNKRDTVTMRWDTDHYDYDGGPWGGPYTRPSRTMESSGPTGVVCGFSDWDAYSNEAVIPGDDNNYLRSWTSISVQPNDSFDPSERDIFANFHHTYDKMELTGGSISNTGVGLKFSENGKKWVKSINKSEDELVDRLG